MGSWLVAVGAIVAAVALVAIDARATYGARVTADEPQYLLTALSLGEDLDLDISDEIAARQYEPFHEITIDPQTVPLNNAGQELSPHDPGLPVLLAGPMRLGGWVGARVAMAVIGALVAALTMWVCVRRFGVSTPIAAAVTVALGVSPPLVSYANQIYPELPAGGAVLAAVALLTRRHQTAWSLIGIAACIVALPWLAVKYAPVAAVLALAAMIVLAREGRWRAVVGFVGGLGFAGAVYLAVHRLVWGGWTVYASGDHFRDGEFGVVGGSPNYVGRSRRLIGLLVDRGFGLAAWNPGWLALPPAVAWVLARREGHRWLLVAVFATGWVTATWVALTMHGWWWPGRQVVHVLPVAVVLIAVLVDRVRWVLVPVVTGGLIGLAGWAWLAIEASTDRRTLGVDFEQTSWWWYRAWRHALPDHRLWPGDTGALTALWIALVSATVAVTWWHAIRLGRVYSPRVDR